MTPTKEELDQLAADGGQVPEGVDPPNEEELKEAWDAAGHDGNPGG